MAQDVLQILPSYPEFSVKFSFSFLRRSKSEIIRRAYCSLDLSYFAEQLIVLFSLKVAWLSEKFSGTTTSMASRFIAAQG
jgi:hypothetical protein